MKNTIRDNAITRHLQRISLTGILLISTAATTSQAEVIDSIRYEAEIRATFSGGEHTPFWLVNNLSGLGSPEKNNGYVRAAAFKDVDKSKKFSWGAGIDLVGGWRQTAPFSIHQLFGEVRYRSLGALIGSKEIRGEFVDPHLSSGDLLYSGNAMPIPQVRLGIFDYADFWGTKGWLAVKGYISYGMFTDSKWQKTWTDPQFKRTKDVLYHSKGIWFRGGNTSKFPLVAEIGIEMATQFGGTYIYRDKVVKMDSGLKSWWHAFFPKTSSTTEIVGEDTSIQGNMLGEYDISLAWIPNADWSVRAYFQHYFEDQSQMTFEYGWKDGLWGIEVQLPKNRFVSTIVYEYLASKDQTGAVLHNPSTEIPEQVSGRDDYYNHYIYSGWQHWGMGIGNPLMLSPIYNTDHHLTFHNTRILAHHLGIAGNPTDNISYRILLSYSRNWGTYTRPYAEVKENFNGLCEVSWKPKRLKGWFANIGLGIDGGKLLGSSFGVMLSIGKNGVLTF